MDDQDDENDLCNSIIDQIGIKADSYSVLRLICLLSSVSGGIEQQKYNEILKFYVSMYGPQEIATLKALQNADLIFSKG